MSKSAVVFFLFFYLDQVIFHLVSPANKSFMSDANVLCFPFLCVLFVSFLFFFFEHL